MFIEYWLPRWYGRGFTYIILLNSPIAQWVKTLLLPYEQTGLGRLTVEGHMAMV
jgi:hypothetical protein